MELIWSARTCPRFLCQRIVVKSVIDASFCPIRFRLPRARSFLFNVQTSQYDWVRRLQQQFVNESRAIHLAPHRSGAAAGEYQKHAARWGPVLFDRIGLGKTAAPVLEEIPAGLCTVHGGSAAGKSRRLSD